MFCSKYIVAVLGNCALLLTMRLDHNLHHPMFYFLGMLGVIDLVMATSVVPKMLSIFWMGAPKIDFDACFIQMFLIHSITAVKSGVLLAMAFDRYVAICHPLRYEAILTSQRVARIGLAILIRGIVFMVPLTWTARRLPYCASKVMQHPYCEHMDGSHEIGLHRPRCKPHLQHGRIGPHYQGTDTAFIAVSYGLILRAVTKLTKKTEQLKAFSTCSSHICVWSLYYLPGMASICIQGFSQGVPPPHVQVLLANLYLILPPTLNPIIYSMQVKQVRHARCKGFPFIREPAG